MYIGNYGLYVTHFFTNRKEDGTKSGATSLTVSIILLMTVALMSQASSYK